MIAMWHNDRYTAMRTFCKFGDAWLKKEDKKGYVRKRKPTALLSWPVKKLDLVEPAG